MGARKAAVGRCVLRQVASAPAQDDGGEWARKLQAFVILSSAERVSKDARRNVPDVSANYPDVSRVSVSRVSIGGRRSVVLRGTYQLSDTSVGSTPLRNLITAHAAAAFIYNTALLALGISILAGLFG